MAPVFKSLVSVNLKENYLQISSPIYSHQVISASSGMVVAQHKQAAKIGVEVL
jgi:hypothetical protein